MQFVKINELNVGFGGGSLLQVANRSHVQMMSCIIDTPDGKTVVIDGGHDCREDGEHLRELIKERGGMTLDIVNNCDNYADYHSVNDTSIVILAHFPKRDVLFLGDLAVQGGKYLLEHFDASKLRCDIVQMAHHGQGGVDKAFYERVQPKICLYNAPDWLWENDNGGGKGSGPWVTLETRKWMEDLNVETSCPCSYGDYLLK